MNEDTMWVSKEYLQVQKILLKK